MKTLGSILFLKEGSQKVMITSRNVLVKMEDQIQLFDYAGCKYPVGLDMNQILYFNEENIDKVLFEGYCDEDEIRINELFKEWKEKNKGKYVKGIVKEKCSE